MPPSQEGGHAHVQLPVGERLTVGAVLRRGSGRLVVLGLQPDPNLLVALHRWLGARIPSRSATPRVQSAMFERATERFVILTNTAPDDRDVHLLLDVVPRAAEDLRTGAAVPVTETGIVARVPARSGTALRML